MSVSSGRRGPWVAGRFDGDVESGMRRVKAALVVAGLLPAAAWANENALAGRPRLEIRRVAQPPTLDGRLDDQAWREAVKVTEFTQHNPREGVPASEQTEVWLGYDSRAIYVAIYAHYSDMSLMRANRADRDRAERDDKVSIYFDTFLDQQRAYRFSVNGYGVQGDAILNAGGGGRGGGPGMGRGEDESWDALFHTAGGPVEDGWIVEMAIPFKSLRYPPPRDGGEHRWGLQITRSIESKDEDVAWAPISRRVEGFLTQMGVLHGMTGLSASRNLEVQPTATAVQLDRRDADSGVLNRGRLAPDFGVNVKYGVTTNLTADFTYNPDFSQIEADRPQIEVNQRYPVFYPERRPFFLEGQEIFSTAVNLVHTRTIVDPRGGAKLTGKVGATSLGLLVANDEAPGRVDDPADPAYGRTARVVVGRVRRDLYAESSLGAIVTDRAFLDTYSRAIGVDGRFRLGRVYRASFMAAATDLRDDEGERLRGYAVQANFGRAGRSLDYSVSHTSLSPDFKTALGFIRRTDMRDTTANLSYTFWPQATVISWGPRARYRLNYDFSGVKQDEEIEAGLNARFARNINVRGNVTREMERYADIDFFKWRYSIGGDANFSRRVSFGGHWNWGDEIRYGNSPYLGRTYGGSASVTLRPGPRLEANVSGNFSRFLEPRTGARVFDVQLYRLRATYQFTDRLLLRQIIEHDTYAGKLGVNLLLTYRVNAGTVLFVGYDDRAQAGRKFDDELYPDSALRRTSRALFMKIAYLYRP